MLINNIHQMQLAEIIKDIESFLDSMMIVKGNTTDRCLLFDLKFSLLMLLLQDKHDINRKDEIEENFASLKCHHLHHRKMCVSECLLNEYSCHIRIQTAIYSPKSFGRSSITSNMQVFYLNYFYHSIKS